MIKEFMVKMIEAKKLECEALRSVMPKPVVEKMDQMEQELIEVVKECVMDEWTQSSTKKETENTKKAHKVTID